MENKDVTYCGPFVYTQGRMFYRDDYETLWEIRPFNDRQFPLEIIMIAGVIPKDSNILDFIRKNG